MSAAARAVPLSEHREYDLFLNVAEATERLKFPVFGDESQIEAVQLLEAREELLGLVKQLTGPIQCPECEGLKTVRCSECGCEKACEACNGRGEFADIGTFERRRAGMQSSSPFMTLKRIQDRITDYREMLEEG